MKALIAVIVVLMIAVVPVPDSDASVSTNIDGESLVATGSSQEYTIRFTDTDYEKYQDVTLSVSYEAALKDSSGETVSSGVSPSSGSMDNGGTDTLTVSVPSTAGTYSLQVTYTVSVKYTDEEGEEQEEELEFDRTFSMTAVDPVTLKVTVTSGSDIDLTGIGVYFYVDGKKMDDSYTTFNLEKEGSTTVSYQWVTTETSGKHTFYVQAADDKGLITDISGLGEEYTFYLGDSDYTVWTAICVLAIIILILVMIWVYRKPVKNYGKPKSRR